jgi:hypothetical protein
MSKLVELAAGITMLVGAMTGADAVLLSGVLLMFLAGDHRLHALRRPDDLQRQRRVAGDLAVRQRFQWLCER